MPRSGTGTYTLPVAAFVAGTVIISGDMNNDLSDIGTALTQSLATTGVTIMTGPLKLANGAVTAPSMAFNAFPGTGFYRVAANSIGIAVASTSIGVINASGTAVWGYDHNFASVVSFASAVSFTGGGIKTSTTVSGALDVTGGMNVGFSAAAVAKTIAVGDANLLLDFNAGTAPRLQFDSNDRLAFTRAANRYDYVINNVTVGTIDATRAFFSGRLDFPEITAPASATANQVAIYAKDFNGVTRMFYKDENGVETAIGGKGYWELIGTVTVATSVANVTFNLSKSYSRIILVGISVTPATAGNNTFAVGLTFGGFSPTFDGSYTGKNGGSVTNFGSLGGPGIFEPGWPTTDEASFCVEYLNMDTTATKVGMGWGATNAASTTVLGGGGIITTAGVGAVSVMLAAFSSSLIQRGKFTMYGMMA